MHFSSIKVGNDRKISINQVPINQPFILEEDEDRHNCEVYVRLETHGSAWQFLRLSDMHQLTMFQLRWSADKPPYVKFVEITNLEVRFKTIEVTRPLGTTVLSLERQYSDKLEVLLSKVITAVSGDFIKTLPADVQKWWEENKDRKLWENR